MPCVFWFLPGKLAQTFNLPFKMNMLGVRSVEIYLI